MRLTGQYRPPTGPHYEKSDGQLGELVRVKRVRLCRVFYPGHTIFDPTVNFFTQYWMLESDLEKKESSE